MKYTRPVKLLFSLTSILTLFYVNQLRDTPECFEAYSENSLQIETGEKISKELLCDMCISLKELYFSSHRGFGNPIWRKSYKGTFGSIRTAMVKEAISSDTNSKEAFYETACDKDVYLSRKDKTFFLLHSFESAS